MFRSSPRQVNLLYAFRALEGVHGGHKIYIGLGQNVSSSSHRRFALPTSLMLKTRSRGYKWVREGEGAPKSFIRVKVELKGTVIKWSHSFSLWVLIGACFSCSSTRLERTHCCRELRCRCRDLMRFLGQKLK